MTTLAERIEALGKELATTMEDAAEFEAILADVRELEQCLEGCLHFDDAFISQGILGDALRGWRYQARAILTKTKGQP